MAAIVTALVVGAIALQSRDEVGQNNAPDNLSAMPDRDALPVVGAGRQRSDEPAIESLADAGEADEAAIGVSDESGSGPRVPIPLGAEHARMADRDEEFASFLERMEQEPRDRAWAGRLEGFLQANFISTLDMANYRMETLECRTRSCLMLAIGYGEEATAGWFTALSELLEHDEQIESLMGGPGNANCGVGVLAPGVYALNCAFVRTDVEVPEPAPEQALSLNAPYPDGVVVEPVDVPDVIVSAIESSDEVYALHRRLEQESFDAGWSSYVEPLIGQFLSTSELAQAMNLIGITCRTTLCEVQMSSNGGDEASASWISVMLDFQQQGWHDMTTVGISESEPTADDPFGFVWMLERRQSP